MGISLTSMVVAVKVLITLEMFPMVLLVHILVKNDSLGLMAMLT